MKQVTVEFVEVQYTLASTATGPGRTLIQPFSRCLEAGSITALLGRSGSGKTTLLRMVNGLLMPTVGEVLVDGRATSRQDLLTLRRSIGYVIQETGLFPHMTVGRNAGLALELAGQPEPKRRARVEEVLALAGLDSSFLDRYPWQLSGGQRQRVGLARAMASDPGVLLMDEPFGALDPITRAEMQTMLRDLLQRVRKTVLLVTHDLNEALFLADRVLFLDGGRLEADLAPRDVLSADGEYVRSYVAAVHRGEERPA